MYQKVIKLSNEKKVFSFIFNQANNFTILDIVEALNITFPTVKRIIDGFLEKKIIIKQEKIGSSVGRKSLTYSYDPNCFYSIGVKVSYNLVEIGVSNTKGIFLKKASIESSIESEELFDLIRVNLDSLFLSLESDIKKAIVGIGISIPGIVINEKQIIEIKENYNLPIGELDKIKDRFKLPVFIENEANLSSITEVFLNYFNNYNLINVVTINESIGMSALHIEEGLNSFYFKAGKINHMIVSDSKGKKCSCGNIGCLGLYVNDNVLLENFKLLFSEIEEYSDIFLKGYADTIEGKKIINDYIHYLSIGLKNLIIFSDPEKIIITGQICRYKKFIEKELSHQVYESGNFYRDKNVIKFSEFCENSSLIGAALFPIIDILF